MAAPPKMRARPLSGTYVHGGPHRSERPVPDTYTRREVHRSEDDWCLTWTENTTFQATCGPANLAEALHEFRLWTTGQGA